MKIKPILSILFLALFPVALLAQDTTFTYFDKDWDETGFEEYAKYYRKSVKDDSVYRVFDYFMSNDQLQMSGAYLDSALEDKKHGHFMYYNEDGEVTQDVNYDAGKLHGDYKRYTQVGGVLLIETTMDQDSMNGETWYYHENGELSSTGKFEKGSRVGIWKYYDKSGNYIAEEMFVTHVEATCGYFIDFENDRWIHANYEDHGKKLKNVTLDRFYRKGIYDDKLREVVLVIEAGCVSDIEDADQRNLDLIASRMANLMGGRAKKVTNIRGMSMDLNDGVLYTYPSKVGKRKVDVYFYAFAIDDSIAEIFLQLDRELSPTITREAIRVLENMSESIQ
ncbi:MAG: hypothetical protein H6608_05440 [Flavobacteriales bacterium]|nr:hypothetical protein [Flavobacteriales bacterium]